LIPFVDLKSQQDGIKQNIDSAIQRVLAHGKYILGPEVEELERRLAQYTGARFCIACGNGTDALQIALMALEVGRGDEVILPAFTYISAAEATVLLGARPVYVDIEPLTYNLDPGQLASAITERTKAIIPTSLFGQPAEMGKINEIADRQDIPVIEDAAQSLGALRSGKKSCNLSLIATTSFFPSKPLGCYGDGGAIFTSDARLAEILRQISRHGQIRRYKHDRIGINSRLDTIQAAILLEKLAIFDYELELRQEVSNRYTSLLQDSGVDAPTILPENSSAWAQYTIRAKRRGQLQEMLREKGIPSTVYYPVSLNRQGAVRTSCPLTPESEKAANEVLSLPMHPYLTAETQRTICNSIGAFFYQAN